MIPIAHFYTFPAIAGRLGAEGSLSRLIPGRGLGSSPHTNSTEELASNKIFFHSLLPCSVVKTLSPLVMNEWMNLFGLCLPVF